MKRRITWFVLVTALTAGIQVGVQRLNEALILDYRVPQTVAQEVAGIILAQYVRDCSWENAHYTYYIASDDHRLDVERLVRETPTLPNVVLYPYTKGVPLQSRQDLIEAKLKSIAIVGGISGTWKQVHLTLVRYVSPVGITHLAFTAERRWFGWIVTSQESHPIS